MNLEILFYFIFSSIALISALFVIFSRNTVYSVFFLILVFLSSTGLLLISEIEFLAIMLTVIYIGAIIILFLFIVMMLNINNDYKDFNNSIYFPTIIILSIIYFFEISFLITKVFSTYHYFIQKYELEHYFNILFSKKLPYEYISTTEYFYKNFLLKSTQIINIETLGQCLYIYYTIIILISGLILIIALIGAVILTYKEKKNLKFYTKNTFEQLSRNFLFATFQIK